jgi:amidase
MSAVPIADAFVERFVVQPTAPGVLGGLSFAVKDLFDVAGRHTGCGNPTWRATHEPAVTNAAVVAALLAAGAKLVGKTRTDEMAYSLDGRNFHEGAPLNPAAPSRLTGGSSSGAASAVAAGELDFAIATDTAGSVRVPAAWCGLIGLRPTHGRVAVAGLTPLAPSFDTVGWLARSGAIMRAVGGVLLAGDAAAARASGGWVVDPALDAQGAADTPAARGDAAHRFAQLRDRARQVSFGIDWGAMAQTLRVLQAAEVWRVHGPWIESAKPHFGPGVAERMAAARAITRDEVRQADVDRAAFIERLDAQLPPGTVLCLPSVPGPAAARNAAPDELQARRAQLFPLTAIASLSGRPQLTLPLRTAAGAPVGVSLMGWRGGDESLLEIAAAFFP